MTQFDQRYQQVETQYNADHITIQQPPLSLTEKQRKLNRTRMLNRVQAIWIDGVFEPSLQGAAPIALEVQKKPNVVMTPLWQVLREFDKTGPFSSATTSIVQVYDHASGEVLILGEPGAGKTTLLLELTRDLLDRAHQDESHPIPVVFPLSSWAKKRLPLTEWLASELSSRYQVPLLLANSWIEADQVLPLLDGLDEVDAPYREACVETINSYRQVHGLLPTVVCSRQTDYLALSTRLLLRTAVTVQPLTPEQIESYLTGGGEQLETLRQALYKDADLHALASTPLMLNVLTAAYRGTVHREIVATGSLGMKQGQVFASYVQRMLIRRSANTHYTPKQTIHWLSSLAGQMKRQGQTVFYLEQLQPDWLTDQRRRLLYRLSVGLAVMLLIGLVFGLGLSLLVGLGFGLVGGLGYGLLIGLGFGLVSGLSYMLVSGFSMNQLDERLRLSPNQGIWRSARKGLLVGLLIGLLGGLVFGLLGGLVFGLLDGLAFGLLIGLRYWVVFGLGYGLGYALLGGLLGGHGGVVAFFQHFVLRFWLWRTGCLPRNLIAFLDDAAERLLLRKVGGGYIFIHRLLLDYFASQASTTPRARENTPPPT